MAIEKEGVGIQKRLVLDANILLRAGAGVPVAESPHPVPLHTTYSSWLNQVELWFAKIEREVIARGVFTSVPDLARKLRRYINAYSANARPIHWKDSDPSHRIRSNELSATGH
jgi:hypothetical protein